jgi:hypothetical protein
MQALFSPNAAACLSLGVLALQCLFIGVKLRRAFKNAL